VLANKIAQDQALTAKTLRLANSSFYGMAKQVTTIQEAITILGFRTVRSLATTAALISAFPGNSAASFDVTPFWRHAVAAAVCARALASHLQVNPEYAYTAGLLHDIGRLVLVTQFQRHYEAVMAYRIQHDCSLLEAEQTILGIDHARVGHLLTKNWKFPEEMQHSFSHHHDALSTDMPALARVVIAANTIAHALDLSKDDNDLVPAVPAGFWRQLGLNDEILFEVFQQTETQFEAASSVLTP
jgi:putative nucleotidyltransferase with HDIG domain